MASLAIHTSSNVRRVVKVHEIRKIVHANPLDRLTLVVGITQFLNVGAVGLDGQMAVHASAESRNVGILRTLDLVVAILTLDLIHPNVQGVIEWQWLLRRIALVVTPTEFVNLIAS
jgi:hypothetical protein